MLKENKTLLLISYFHLDEDYIGSHRLKALHSFLLSKNFKVIVLCAGIGKNQIEFDSNIIKVKEVTSRSYSLLRILLIRFIEKVNIFNKSKFPGSGWTKNVIKYSNQIIKFSNPDFIICSYPPVSVLQIGIYFRNKFSIPLLSDFRDGFTKNPIELDIFSNKVKHQLYLELEKEIINKSIFITTASPGITKDFISNYPKKNKFYTIFNGYDDIEFPNNKTIVKLDSKKISISHTGKLSLSQSCISISSFCKSLDFIEQNDKISSKIEFIFMGDLSKKEKSSLKKFTNSGLVKIINQQKREISRELIKLSDFVLLITCANDPTSVSGKLIEYLGFKKKILALTKNTYAEEIINKSGLGICVDPNNELLIYEAILKLINENVNDARSINNNYIEEFSRINQNNKYYDLIIKHIEYEK